VTVREALRLVERAGVMLEAARGPVPSLAEAIAGGPIRGSWWSHPRGREIFALTRAVRESPDILVARLVGRHLTYVHRRLWPALVRIAPRLARTRLARVREVHTASGAHRIELQAFPGWVPEEVKRQAASLTEEAALGALGGRPTLGLSEPASRREKSSASRRASRKPRDRK
jgi:hypothetical protein